MATGKENEPHDHVYKVTGSHCEPIGRFAIDRPLLKIEIDDILVMHDAGACGHSWDLITMASLGPQSCYYRKMEKSSK